MDVKMSRFLFGNIINYYQDQLFFNWFLGDWI